MPNTNPQWAPIFTRLEPPKRKALKRLAAERNTTVSDLVREAVDRFLDEEAKA
jgi:hypothetical protein